MLSKRMSSIHLSQSMQIMAKAKQRIAAGEDIISLALGEPDFPTPEHIVIAAKNAIREGKTKYTPADGIPHLKEAIRKKFLNENHLTYQLNEITVGSGGKQLIFNALMATLNPGDEVIIPAPYWLSYPDMVRLAEGTPKIVPCSADSGFKLTPDKLQDAISANTKWLIINSPGNPTGAIYSKEELSALAGVLVKYPNILVLADDIYEHIRFTAPSVKHATMAQVSPQLQARTLTINGVSKAYCMTGWRVGFAAGPIELIKTINTLQSQSTSCACSISQMAAIAALQGDKTFIAQNNKQYLDRRDSVLAILDDACGLEAHSPDGSFYAFFACGDLIGCKTKSGYSIESDADMAEFFLAQAGVAVVPGSAYGSPDHFRLSFATSLDLLESACQRIKSVCLSMS